MFFGQAKQLCPSLQAVPYDFHAYKEVARTMYETLARYVRHAYSSVPWLLRPNPGDGSAASGLVETHSSAASIRPTPPVRTPRARLGPRDTSVQPGLSRSPVLPRASPSVHMAFAQRLQFPFMGPDG